MKQQNTNKEQKMVDPYQCTGMLLGKAGLFLGVLYLLNLAIRLCVLNFVQVNMIFCKQIYLIKKNNSFVVTK